MRADRTIAFARSRDGRSTQRHSGRVRLCGDQAVVGGCDVDPAEFIDRACEIWRHWRRLLPADRGTQLVSEVGFVRDEDWTRTYAVAHANGAILDCADRQFPAPLLPETVSWSEVPENRTLVLGPSATLSLVDFILDGMPGVLDSRDWPFAPNLVIEDTTFSPYPPQVGRNDGVIRVEAANMGFDDGHDTAFMLLQRGERWQRPVNALYNVRRRNLAIRCDDGHRGADEARVVIDTLTAEAEPTLARSRWLATWYLDQAMGLRWGRERLGLCVDTGRALRGPLVAIGLPQPACICDPIEGEIYGIAPSLEVPWSSITTSVVPP